MNMDMKQPTERGTGDGSHPAPLTPPVDIFEDAEGITVKADLPGVAKENLAVGIEGDTLTVEATASLGEAAGMQPVYAEERVAQFKRSFVLSRDLDTERITADIRQGVLTLKVPKREAAKPRRVEVRLG